MSSADYWLLTALCPACRSCDHGHCDPDRCDDPKRLCECKAEVLPEQREADGS